MGGSAPAVPSGRKWKGSQSCQGAIELGFPRPTLGQMQSEAARRAGEPSGEGEEASSQGLGGHHLLTQTDARCPASEVVGHHLDRQPGGVGGEAARGGRWLSPTPCFRYWVAGKSNPALTAAWWRSSKAMWMRPGWLRGSIYSVLLVWGWVYLSKSIIPEAQEHFLVYAPCRNTPSIGGFGLTVWISQPKRYLVTSDPR